MGMMDGVSIGHISETGHSSQSPFGHHIDTAILGGFNRSSQHPKIGGCDDGWSTSVRTMHTAEVAFAGKAPCLAA